MQQRHLAPDSTTAVNVHPFSGDPGAAGASSDTHGMVDGDGTDSDSGGVIDSASPQHCVDSDLDLMSADPTHVPPVKCGGRADGAPTKHKRYVEGSVGSAESASRVISSVLNSLRVMRHAVPPEAFHVKVMVTDARGCHSSNEVLKVLSPRKPTVVWGT